MTVALPPPCALILIDGHWCWMSSDPKVTAICSLWPCGLPNQWHFCVLGVAYKSMLALTYLAPYPCPIPSPHPTPQTLGMCAFSCYSQGCQGRDMPPLRKEPGSSESEASCLPRGHFQASLKLPRSATCPSIPFQPHVQFRAAPSDDGLRQVHLIGIFSHVSPKAISFHSIPLDSFPSPPAVEACSPPLSTSPSSGSAVASSSTSPTVLASETSTRPMGLPKCPPPCPSQCW